ncbi:MAG: hypothetical protein Q8878_09665, partial [Bacillota bacterium]|nr:hypothetical protein [Bacillota bacterium]
AGLYCEKTPVPKRKRSMGGPHTNPLSFLLSSSNMSDKYIGHPAKHLFIPSDVILKVAEYFIYLCVCDIINIYYRLA